MPESTSAYYLHVPVLRKLFNEISDPGPLNAIQITEMLDLAGDTLARVDRPVFFSKFSQVDAVQYFYEPFLDAFDPQLRKDLGVWYTPREIVHYMVERVDHLLRTELNQPLGLASTDVCVLDPCCGTGAYLTAVLDRVHRTLVEEAGDDAALVPDRVRAAALTRIFGFEILPAPFVISHLQIAAQLLSLGAPLNDSQRAGVFLTNALTGWVPEQEPKKSIFPDLQKEKEDAEAVKRRPSILVIIGNPPYNGYPGIAKVDEERDLTTEYRYTTPGLPKSEGAGLNDLYVRFFRIAERRILRNDDGKGIMSFISNYSWLDGFSHPTMRYRLLNSFDNLFIDNLNGDAYRTGKVTPDGKPDPSAFSTPRNRVGIQVGTAIATLVRGASATENNGLHIRNLWGTGKLEQLLHESEGSGPDNYEMLIPEPKLGIPFAKLKYIPQYLDWPLYIELFPQSSPGLTTSRDPVVVDIDRSALESRIKRYLDPNVSDADITAELPVAMKRTKRFNALETRSQLLKRGFRAWQVLPYAYRPFDERWVYWESKSKLLDEKRLSYLKDLDYVAPALVLTQQSRKTFDGPMVISSVMDFNVADGAAAAFPEFIFSSSLLEKSPRVPNLSKSAWAYVEATGVTAQDLMLHGLSVTHAPSYQHENSGALLRDFPRIPLPASGQLLLDSASLGRKLADLLDPRTPFVSPITSTFLSRLTLPMEGMGDGSLALTAGWGYHQDTKVMAGNGKAEARPWTETERERLASLAATYSLTLAQALTLLGDTCLDVYLNGATFWAAVPANVWDYTLGGYQVLKKWLSYRELPLLDRPLRSDESDYFAQVVRRITAILLLGPALDASYEAILPTAIGLPPGTPAHPPAAENLTLNLYASD